MLLRLRKLKFNLKNKLELLDDFGESLLAKAAFFDGWMREIKAPKSLIILPFGGYCRALPRSEAYQTTLARVLQTLKNRG